MSVEEKHAPSLYPLQPHHPDSSSQSLHRDVEAAEAAAALPRWRAVLIMVAVSLMTLMSTTLSGILAVALPKVATDIGLEEGLLLWPASVYSLACGCTLLFFGSLSDVVGAKKNYLTGSFLSSVWIMACGLAQSGVQLIVFRTMHGIAISMCLPSSVSILSRNFSPGSRRNAAFAMLGAAQPTGFLIGLVIGGILTDLVSWRWCFYAVAIVNAVVFLLSCFSLPPDPKTRGTVLQRFRREADWVGVFILSAALALLSYVLAAVTVEGSAIRSPANIAMLVLAFVLFPVFGLWVHRQERRGLPALIPNSLWSNSVFVSISLLVFLAWATVTANQYFIALFFERVQLLSAFATSLRFLAMVVTGVLANIATGFLVRRVRADLLIGASVAVSAVTPLLMALADPALPYWNMAFPAALLSPIAADVVLTISNLAIVTIFPPETHGLAGGVTNTLAQLGTSLGLNLTAILASAVTMGSSYVNKTAPAALELGYKAAFWASFGATLAMLVIVVLGLRKIGKVGAAKKN
ncbi:Aminotriazole resistance protein [Madurella fahalii]|uniref:Aminotriazole resistance protein n=1 Tax=Madurella fahalii TaxID=1157608 RepID=A0ABQ0GG26_9PEZI